MMWFILGCTADPVVPRPADPDDTDDDTDDTDDTDGACADIAALPVAQTALRGFSGSEDFAFDGEGNIVSVDENGNLVRQSFEGVQQVLLPGFGLSSGTRFLPGGDLVIGSPTDGAVYRVTPEGASWVLVSGLAYPNGLEVDPEGFVYVSEQGARRVRRVDSESGEWTVVADDLHNPNGITFSPDYQTMLVGSFGDGTVTAIDRDGDGWAAPRVYVTTPDAPYFQRGGGCDGHAAGEGCFLDYGGLGVCDAALECVDDPDLAACATLADGDACVTSFLDDAVNSTCTAALDGALFCPRADADRQSACEGVAEYGGCRVGRDAGYCITSWEAVPLCVTEAEYYDAYIGDCAAQAEGDACSNTLVTGPWRGTCAAYEAWGSDLYCAPPEGFGERGGLDGITTDACGNVYVTEYIKGIVWRFAAEGAPAEIVAELPSQWIPNLHWGLGIGGWERDRLYVMERERGRIFALEVGVEEKPRAFDPAGRGG